MNLFFFDEHTKKEINPLIEKFYDISTTEFSLYFYAKKNDVSFKIEIINNTNGYAFISIYPLKPYCMKKGYESEQEKLDVAFYIKCLLELCENFAIYELKTFF